MVDLAGGGAGDGAANARVTRCKGTKKQQAREASVVYHV